MSEGRVLGEILETLQRLETRIDGQKGRLDAIELSIRSGGASSIATNNSILNSDRDSTAPEKLHECPSPITPPSAEQPTCPASVYRESIAEMRKRFEFVDTSRSDVNPRRATSPNGLQWDQTRLTPSPNQDEGSEDEAVYTESAYSRPLSRLDPGDGAEAPPLPTNIWFQRDFRGGPPSYGGERHHEPVAEARDMQTSHSAPAHTEDEIWTVRYEDVHLNHRQAPEEMPQTARAGTETLRRHEHIEMMYLAWDNFRASLCSSSWRFSSNQRAARNERRRLSELSATASRPRQGPGGGVLKWCSLAIQVIRRTETQGLGKMGMVTVA
ncbi:uncharacterized protein B0H64DRAFT_455418 [Chaetomium fimeti]|uniref:Uncharacterized protein n=1 Tax=Chaetomium fimeti TaxID=1854472 RepID=A0AAE0HMV5_9PEZI|nr:hypothetical protein B0H64DRAFT_455418 [Chaetomium fimeti]